MLRIGHIELFVADTARTRRFYTHVLGARIIQEQAEGRIVWLSLGDVEILLRPGIPAGSPNEAYQQARSGIVLYSDQLDKDVSSLTERGLVLEGDDGPGCFTFRDPDGNWFQLVDPTHA